jgi:hypothetical protein
MLVDVTHVQVDHDPCGGNSAHPVPEDGVFREVEGDAAGFRAIQEAGRLSGLGNRILGELRPSLFGSRAGPFHLEMIELARSKPAIRKQTLVYPVADPNSP